jgi:hypothetical protein
MRQESDGVLLDFMGTRGDPSERSLGECFVSYEMSLICHGCAQETLMKFFSIMNNLVAMTGRNGRWRASGNSFSTVASLTWATLRTFHLG